MIAALSKLNNRILTCISSFRGWPELQKLKLNDWTWTGRLSQTSATLIIIFFSNTMTVFSKWLVFSPSSCPASAKWEHWEVHIMHINFMLTFLHINADFFAYFASICNWDKLMGQMHMFAYILHICAYLFFAYFCIFMLMHILACNAYQDIYLAFYAYFRNAYLCMFRFAYFCKFLHKDICM